MKALREYWAEVREEWRVNGKMRALAWLVAVGVIVGLAMFAALAQAINA